VWPHQTSRSRAVSIPPRSCRAIVEETAERVASKIAFVVPTLLTHEALERLGVEAYLEPLVMQKLARVRQAGLRAIEV